MVLLVRKIIFLVPYVYMKILAFFLNGNLIVTEMEETREVYLGHRYPVTEVLNLISAKILGQVCVSTKLGRIQRPDSFLMAFLSSRGPKS